jgi:DNA-binding MltR family transcriptional regulator
MAQKPKKPSDRPASPRFKSRKNPAAQEPKEISLRRLTRLPPEGRELSQVWDEINKQHHRAAAIMAGAMVESALEGLLDRLFVELSDDEYQTLFDYPGSLSSFGSKIMVGYAAGFYDKTLKKDLDIIRVVRNAFAHAKKPITFDTLQIAAEINQIGYVKWKTEHKQDSSLIVHLHMDASDTPNRYNYVYLCRLLTFEFWWLSLDREKPGFPKTPIAPYDHAAVAEKIRPKTRLASIWP